MPAEPIAILYCIDDAYVRQAAVALASLLDAMPDTRFEVTVAAVERDPALCEAVFAPVMARRRNAVLRFVDLDGSLFDGLPVTRTFSHSIYTRLVLQRFVDPRHRRLLYLDADTIVGGDITALWRAELGDATLGAVRDHFRLDPARIGFAEGEPYFNSGVLLIDMECWRARNCEKRIFDILARCADRLPWTDQDALNIALRGEVRFLDLRWNWQPRCADVPADFLGLDQAAYQARRSTPDIVHYTTSFKPWNAAYRVHYSRMFFAAAKASGIPEPLLPANPAPRGFDQRLLGLKTRLRWRIPGAFQSLRRLIKPEAAAAMYRAGPGD